AFTAAELVLANQRNRMVLDYSVQLYSQSAVSQSAGSNLGLLKQGTYVVVGRPVAGTRAFWEKALTYPHQPGEGWRRAAERADRAGV
ncbi:MAG: hypothetical protein KBO59_25585, partial [Achromobacter sp.]|nr:hypothetical protein [Achromobacter sp.]